MVCRSRRLKSRKEVVRVEQSHQDQECVAALLPLQRFVALPARDGNIFIDTAHARGQFA